LLYKDYLITLRVQNTTSGAGNKYIDLPVSEYQIKSVSPSHIEILHVVAGPTPIPQSLTSLVKPIEQNQYSIRYMADSPNIKPKNGKANRYFEVYRDGILMCHT
jgi:hypothetical protein